jgi:hypothetical protein
MAAVARLPSPLPRFVDEDLLPPALLAAEPLVPSAYNVEFISHGYNPGMVESFWPDVY